jgi:hypothetical protein
VHCVPDASSTEHSAYCVPDFSSIEQYVHCVPDASSTGPLCDRNQEF